MYCLSKLSKNFFVNIKGGAHIFFVRFWFRKKVVSLAESYSYCCHANRFYETRLFQRLNCWGFWLKDLFLHFCWSGFLVVWIWFKAFVFNNPVIVNPDSEEYNLKIKVDELLNYTTTFTQHYTTNHVYVAFGSDFQFSSAQSYFKNIDKLIKGANERQVNGSKFNVFYSTPSCYLQALYQSNKTYQTKTDDFFPYGSDSHSDWTGYFSSRPALKYYDKRANNILQVCKQLNVFNNQNGWPNS